MAIEQRLFEELMSATDLLKLGWRKSVAIDPPWENENWGRQVTSLLIIGFFTYSVGLAVYRCMKCQQDWASC